MSTPTRHALCALLALLAAPLRCGAAPPRPPAAAAGDGVAAPPDVEARVAACDGGDAPACLALAFAYASGEDGVARDEAHAKAAMERAQALFAAGCDRRDALACATLGMLVLAGGDPLRGAIYLKRACDAGGVESCSLLGVMLKRSGDTLGARRAFERACALGEEVSCGQLADLALAADPPDLAAAAGHLDRACELGSLADCDLAERLRAAPRLRAACARGEGRACFRLAELKAADPELDGVEDDVAELTHRACQLGWLRACTRVEWSPE